MLVIGAVLVFVGLVVAGLLAGIFVVLVRLARGRDEQHAEAMERAEEHHRALCAQLTATSTTSMERAHLLASGLAAEIRTMAAAHRNDLRLAMRLPPLRAPGESARDTAHTAAKLAGATPPASSSTTRPRAPEPIVLTAGDEDATPPSGWSLEQIRAHTARSEEPHR